MFKKLRNVKAIEREKKLMEKLLKRVKYKPTKGKYRHDFPDLTVESKYKTSDRICGNGFKRKHGITYTGNQLLGIGTLHKSNAVPISKNSKDAIHQANMRR